MSAATRVKTLYQDHEHLGSHNAKVTWVGTTNVREKTYYSIRLDETIFHPHGGGQLSDQGTIDGRRVDFVAKMKLSNDYNDFEVDHCFEQPHTFEVGNRVQMTVDLANRHTNSLWHTAAHVVDYNIVKLWPSLKGHSGQCYPNNAFMKFVRQDGEPLEKEHVPATEEVRAKIEAEFEKSLKPDTSIEVVRHDGIRHIRIQGHDIPCGGTHVHKFSELGRLRIRDCKFTKDKNEEGVKEGFFKVSFLIQ